MKRVSLFIGLTIVLLLGSCAGTPTPLGELQGRIDGAVSAYVKGLQVVTPESIAPVKSDGSFEATVPSEGINVIMALSPGSVRPVLMGVKFSEKLYRPGIARYSLEPPRLDAESTALALVMLDPFFVGVSDESRADMAEVIVSLPEFQELVNAIDKALQENPYTALNPNVHPEIYRMALDIVPRALEAKFGTSRIKYVRSGVTVDEDLPWVECTGGNAIKFMNPTMVYYWADIVEYDYQNGGAFCDTQQSHHFILPRTRFYDLTCVFHDISCVLDLFQTPPKETDWSNFPAGGARLVGMYKGFGSRTIGFIECGAKDNAMYANLWQSIKYILALATNLGNLLPDGHLVVTGLRAVMDENEMTEFRQALQTMDMWTVINYVINIISLFKDQIVSYLSQQFGSDAANTFLSAATSVLGDVLRFASMAYELTSRTGPYFYDLVTSGEYSAYYVDPDGGCLVDGSPIALKLMPNVISPGGKLTILGFFFGNSPGEVWVGGSRVTNILFWSDNNVTVQVPPGNPNTNEVYVVSASGKQSNVIRTRIKTSRGGGEESGGCEIASEGAHTSPLNALILLIPAFFALVIRRKLRRGAQV